MARHKRNVSVIVIGGGVAGLTAAAELARRGAHVTLLEARERLGGRVFTQRPKNWGASVELGAEFIHAGNAALWRRLKKFGLEAGQVPAKHWRFNGHELSEIKDVAAEIESVTEQIDEQTMRGWSFARFLRDKRALFSDEQRAVTKEFVEGFEAAPAEHMSAVAMAGESLDTSQQFSLAAGYDRLVDALAAEARGAGVDLRLDCPVKIVGWRRGGVVVRTADDEFAADAAIVTLPLGVLQARPRERGAVVFRPTLGERQRLIRRMHMGHVIRVTFRFDPRAWARALPAPLRGAKHGFGFIHSRVAGVPVWWSLSAKPVITGWAGGPAALKLAGRPRRQFVDRALGSLAEILGVSRAALRRAVADVATHNWSRDPFSRGAYTFVTAGLENAAEKLREPIAGTLFFAGEATADGSEIGTVHGALASGLRAAREVLKKK